MSHQYNFISSDTHLEVLPERWTGRVPAKYRDKMPRTVAHPDGGDALYIEGAPLFQVAYLDLRAGRRSEDWQPFGVSVADFWYERHRHWAQRYLGFKPLQRKPSEYIRDHFLFSVQGPERVAIELRHHVGVDHIMFATDFPHIECEWPNTKPALDALTADLSSEETYKIVAGNVIDYFGLDPAILTKQSL